MDQSSCVLVQYVSSSFPVVEHVCPHEKIVDWGKNGGAGYKSERLIFEKINPALQNLFSSVRIIVNYNMHLVRHGGSAKGWNDFEY